MLETGTQTTGAILYRYLLRVVKKVMPKQLVCENVVGFSEPRNSQAFQSLQDWSAPSGVMTYRLASLMRLTTAFPNTGKRVFLIAVLEGRADWVFECLRPQTTVPTVIDLCLANELSQRDSLAWAKNDRRMVWS